jgi:hypothetical protein
VPASVSLAAESSPKVAVVAFGLFDDQSVVESEAKGGSGERMGEGVARRAAPAHARPAPVATRSACAHAKSRLSRCKKIRRPAPSLHHLHGRERDNFAVAMAAMSTLQQIGTTISWPPLSQKSFAGVVTEGVGDLHVTAPFVAGDCRRHNRAARSASRRYRPHRRCATSAKRRRLSADCRIAPARPALLGLHTTSAFLDEPTKPHPLRTTDGNANAGAPGGT